MSETPSATTPFSIIVPVYNGAETLDRCLTALTHQDYPAQQYEIIVVDDGSTDNTAQIAATYPVRLIRLPQNQGRVVARNTGARAATFETLLFNDVRVASPPTLLQQVNEYNYVPLMPNAVVYNGRKWGFSRFYHLLRHKIYAPHYPLTNKPDFFITPENFEKVPKGTTVFICDRQMWLNSQPPYSDQMTSDDTLILRAVVEHRPIQRANQITVYYQERSQWGAVLRHVLQRGPLFADYYLRRGGRYHRLYLALWGLLLLTLLTLALFPLLLLPLLFITLFAFFALALHLSQTPLDVLVIWVHFPAIILTFGLGILRWHLHQFK